MLTPMDIHNAEFKTVFRGYDPKQVDDFLVKVLGEYEGIINDNKQLKAEVELLQSKLERYSSLEQTISSTLTAAREISDQLKTASSKEAEAMTRTAEAKIRQMWAECERHLASEVSKIRELHERERSMWSRLRETLKFFEQMSDKYDEQREQFEEWVEAFMEAAASGWRPADKLAEAGPEDDDQSMDPLHNPSHNS